MTKERIKRLATIVNEAMLNSEVFSLKYGDGEFTVRDFDQFLPGFITGVSCAEHMTEEDVIAISRATEKLSMGKKLGIIGVFAENIRKL